MFVRKMQDAHQIVLYGVLNVIFIHQYSCTCPDLLVHLTKCKHIHLLIRKLYKSNIYNVHNTSHTITSDVYV